MRYQKHENFWANLRIYSQIIMRSLMLGLAFQIIFLLYFANGIFDEADRIRTIDGGKLPSSVAVKYYTGSGDIFTQKVAVEKALLPYSKGWNELPKGSYRVVADYATGDAYKVLAGEFDDYLLWSFSMYSISAVYLLIFLRKKTDDEKYIRGAKLISAEKLNQLLRDRTENEFNNLHVGETILPIEMETKHLLILGTSGSGKGVLLNQLIKQIENRNSQKCVFYDIKGEFIEKQYDPKSDLIFSPFDARTLRWNLFNELEIRPDFDVVSRSLFASNDEKNMYWYNCAADVFRTGLIYLKMVGKTTNRDLWEFFSQTVTDIVDAFIHLPLSEQGAMKHIDKVDSPAAASIISILQERIQFFRYLEDIDGDFSFRRYIRENEGKRQNLFILNIEQYNIIFRPLMTLTIEMMCREALSLADDKDRRIFFVLDELGTLGKMDSVLQLLTVGRSKGACLFCASQDLGRIETQYGKPNLRTFFNNFNTKITLRILEPETSEFLSKAIGEHQILKTTENLTTASDKKSLSEQERNERLVLPTEFQELPDLTAIINVAGFGISKIMIPPIFYPKVHENFRMRHFENMLQEVDREQLVDMETGEVLADAVIPIKEEETLDTIKNI